jgi:YHS domain-containing protein
MSHTWTRREAVRAMSTLAVLVGSARFPRPAAAAEPVFQSGDGVAASGHDPVAYFTEGRPVAGRPEFETRWNGATWRFASAANRDLFLQAPERYAPQYGAYCAYAVSRGYTAKTDPAAWKIVDGKLYLNYSRQVQGLWERDVPGNIYQADRNWPEVLKK